MIGLAIAIFYFLAFLAIFFALLLTFYASLIGAPYFRSPKKAVREALKLIAAQPGKKFFELGAGDGNIMALAEKEFDLEPTGFELSPIFWLIAKVNLFSKGAKKSRLICRDFFKQDLSEADIVFCFLLEYSTRRLEAKLKKELKPGAKIISVSFPLQNWKPKYVIESSPGNTYIYEI